MNLVVVAIKRCDIGWPLVVDEEPDDRASLAGIKRITTSVLTDRLTTLLQKGILTKQRSPADRRRESYSLTEKGVALIPVLVELANWGVTYGPEVATNPLWVAKAKADPVGLRQ